MSVLRLRTIISRSLGITKDAADLIIGEGRVRVNGSALPPSAKIRHHQEVTLDGKAIRTETSYTYILYYKPRGIECTLNEAIPQNLLSSFDFPERLYPVGRLDKDSEGLLLLTNNGRVFKRIAWSEMNKEKEYWVETDLPVTQDFLEKMAAGVEILGKRTKPALTFPSAENKYAFRIILTQGLNRQIRRMTHKLGYSVTRLIRTRIMHLQIGALQSGEWRRLSEIEVKKLLIALSLTEE